MRLGQLLLVVLAIFVTYCSANISPAVDSRTTPNMTPADKTGQYPDSNGRPVRYLRGGDRFNQEDEGITNAADEEERGRANNLDSVLKKSASMNKFKSAKVGDAEVNKIKTLLKAKPRLTKSFSMTEAHIRKVRNIVAKNPELRKVKSLVTNPQKLTQDEIKLVAKFAKEHPKEGASILQWIFLIGGLGVVLSMGAIVIGSTAAGSK